MYFDAAVLWRFTGNVKNASELVRNSGELTIHPPIHPSIHPSIQWGVTSKMRDTRYTLTIPHFDQTLPKQRYKPTANVASIRCRCTKTQEEGTVQLHPTSTSVSHRQILSRRCIFALATKNKILTNLRRPIRCSPATIADRCLRRTRSRG